MDLIRISSSADIGALIKSRRKSLGLSQSLLSTITGIAQPNLSKIERGESASTIATYLKLFESLGIDFFAVVRQ